MASHHGTERSFSSGKSIFFLEIPLRDRVMLRGQTLTPPWRPERRCREWHLFAKTAGASVGYSLRACCPRLRSKGSVRRSHQADRVFPLALSLITVLFELRQVNSSRPHRLCWL